MCTKEDKQKDTKGKKMLNADMQKKKLRQRDRRRQGWKNELSSESVRGDV